MADADRRAKGQRARILITRILPDQVMARAGDAYETSVSENDEVLNADQIAAMAHGCDGLLVTPSEKITAGVIDALPDSIRIIATFSVGYDHIDTDAATRRGIIVTNTPEVLTDATADIALLLLLGAARGGGWGEKMVRTASWPVWTPTAPLGSEVTGQRLGIYGFGRIGRAVAKRARAFDMPIHYHSRNPVDAGLEQGAVYHDTLEGLLAVSDFLSINCASTPKTRGSIDAKAIEFLPQGAIIVNTARGDIVDDDALIGALRSGRVAAAGLDVYRGEPDIDPRYRELENTFLLPHLGSATVKTRVGMGMRALDNLDAYFADCEPNDRVV